MPTLGYVSFTDNPAINVQQFFFPWLAMGTRLIGTTLRMTRSTMLEVLHQDYIRTAWSKGLGERGVVYRHALKNSMIPVITIIGGQIAFLLGGSVVIESVFGLPGLGSLTLQSIYQRDYPQIQGNVLLIALFVIVVNLITDISYAWFDPRIRYN
jgi:peptide/nickel transport system permease protein